MTALGFEPIADGDIGGLWDELEDLQTVCVHPSRAPFWINRVRRMMLRAGAQDVFLFHADAPLVRGVTKAALRLTRTEEMIGPIRQSDMTAIIDLTPLIDAGFAVPLRQELTLVVNVGTSAEHAYQAVETPAMLMVGATPVLARAIVRG